MCIRDRCCTERTATARWLHPQQPARWLRPQRLARWLRRYRLPSPVGPAARTPAPHKRAEALKLPYFAPLPAELVPNVAEPTRTPEEIESTFAFEYEKMGVNDLRILIANDLFRMNRTL